MKRELLDVVDENITAVGYDEATFVMEIEFTNGTIFQYADVPKGVHVGLMAATDPGKYFARYIKNKFKFFEIDKN